MTSIELAAISVALGLDAFGVAFSLGLDRRVNRNNAVYFIISFGFFQSFFVFLGGFGGELFNRYICTIPTVIGGIIIILVGLLMIKEGLEEESRITKFHWGLIIILGMSVSIDALVIGFSTFNMFFNKIILLKKSAVVGIITCILTTFAFFFSRNMRKIELIKEYADFLGGTILILFGIKMILF